jgi:Domain of unknown function (DUF4266)
MIQRGSAMSTRLCIPFMIFGAILSSGCSSLGVKAWQRDVLARPDMQLGADPLDAAIDDHLYFSKEASSGGRSFAGGGCGCN